MQSSENSTKEKLQIETWRKQRNYHRKQRANGKTHYIKISVGELNYQAGNGHKRPQLP